MGRRSSERSDMPVIYSKDHRLSFGLAGTAANGTHARRYREAGCARLPNRPDPELYNAVTRRWRRMMKEAIRQVNPIETQAPNKPGKSRIRKWNSVMWPPEKLN